MSKLRTVALGFQFQAPAPKGLTRERIDAIRRWLRSPEGRFFAGQAEMLRCTRLSREDLRRLRDRVRELAR